MLKTLLNAGEPFFVASKGVAEARFALWAKELPAVKPFYAVKCNPDRQLLQWAAAAGWGFDCASPMEYKTVTGIAPHAEIVYANPCKSPQAIAAVAAAASTTSARHPIPTTFDSPEELEKLGPKVWPGSLILRLRVDDSGSKQPFGSKFGCELERVPAIMRAASAASLRLSGVSFHVGSHCFGAGSYSRAITAAHEVVDKYRDAFAGEEVVIDIGGGFPGEVKRSQGLEDEGLYPGAERHGLHGGAGDDRYPGAERHGLETGADLFKSQAAEIRAAMMTNIGDKQLRYIAEPGRFLATAPYILYVPIIAKRRQGTHQTYTVDESLYSSFSCVPFDGYDAQCEAVFSQSPALTRESEEAVTVYGRTCDSQDIVMKGRLPPLNVGDYLAFRNMGAYTAASSSEFNGFPRTKVVYM